jgi:hypothetical protein
MLPAEIRAHLLDLAEERAAAALIGLDAHPDYSADFEAEVLTYRRALAGALLTEIAIDRARRLGRQTG